MTEYFDTFLTRTWRIAWLAALIAAAGIGRVEAAPASPAIDQIPFRIFAQQLLAGIDNADPADIPAIGGYGKPRLALVPFNIEKGVISATLASEFNDRLLAELTRQGRHRYRLVSREALKSVIREIDSINELEPGRDRRVADLLRSARVDILVIGSLRKEGARASLSYKAVSIEDGMVFAATEPRHIALVAKPVVKPPTATPHRRGPVFRVQRLLVAAGFDPGPVNGILRPTTRRAIRKFQRARGLAVNGRLTRALARALRRDRHRNRETVLALP